MKPLPQGKSLGWMQAPASWITTHTLRFIGVARVVIQDGEGFILIKKGKSLFYYFKRGTIELKGNTALDYFNSHPVIDFNLCKYNPDEFAWALKLCNIEDHEPVVPKEMNVSVPVSRQPTLSSRPADPRSQNLSMKKESLNRTWFTQRNRGLKTGQLFQYRYPGNQPCHPARQIHRSQNLSKKKESLDRSRFTQRSRGLKTGQLFQNQYPGNQPCHPVRQIHQLQNLSRTKESLNRTWFTQRFRIVKTGQLFQIQYPGNQPCHPNRQIHRSQSLSRIKESLPRSRFPHGFTHFTKERLYRNLLMVMIQT